MRWSDVDLSPDRTKLRQFAALLLLVCTGIAGVLWMRSGAIAERPAVLIAIGIVWALAGIAAPATIRTLFVVLTVAVFPIGWLVSRVVLAVIYYLVLTPIGFLLRLKKHDPLGLDRDRRETFWKRVEPRTDFSSYFRQF
jgi:carbamoyltransferase